MRLAGGSTVYEGRVEVYRNGVWGTVCNELWDDQNTAVVCTSMGFSSWVVIFSLVIGMIVWTIELQPPYYYTFSQDIVYL